MPPHEPAEETRIERALDSLNAGYIAELYAQYRRDPASVDQEWRSLFESGAGGFEPAPPQNPPSGGNGSGAVTRRHPGPRRSRDRRRAWPRT